MVRGIVGGDFFHIAPNKTVILYSGLPLDPSLFFAWPIAVWDALQSTFWSLERGVYAGLTQGEVAARMGTTQSVVARIESGRGTPSMRTVQRFASAVGARAVVRMEPLTATQK